MLIAHKVYNLTNEEYYPIIITMLVPEQLNPIIIEQPDETTPDDIIPIYALALNDTEDPYVPNDSKFDNNQPEENSIKNPHVKMVGQHLANMFGMNATIPLYMHLEVIKEKYSLNNENMVDLVKHYGYAIAYKRLSLLLTKFNCAHLLNSDQFNSLLHQEAQDIATLTQGTFSRVQALFSINELESANYVHLNTSSDHLSLIFDECSDWIIRVFENNSSADNTLEQFAILKAHERLPMRSDEKEIHNFDIYEQLLAQEINALKNLTANTMARVAQFITQQN